MKAGTWSFFGAVAVTLAGLHGAAAEELTISIWGGKYADIFKKEVAEPFEKATGATVRVDAGLSSERLSKLMATRGRGTDIIYLTDYQMAEANARGLLQPIDPAKVPNLAGIRDFAKDPLGGSLCPAFTVAGVGIAYNKDQFPQPPQSWKDLFRTDLKGKTGYVDMNVSYGPLMLIEVADLFGGSIDKVDPAFAKLKSVKDRLQFFSRREILDAINQGDVSLAPHLNIFVTKDDSVPLRFTWPQEGGLGVLNLVCVVKGSKNADLAQKFINYHLSKDVQQAMLTEQGETPVIKVASIPEDSKFNIIPAAALDKLRFFDVKKIVENRDAWLKRWQEEILAR